MKPGKAAREMTVRELAAYIDHSVLKPEFTPAEVRREVEAAISYGCKTVCVNPASIEIARTQCQNTETGVCVVVDFPFGCSSTESKVEQTRIALQAGADEVDVVANYGWIRGDEMDRAEADLRAVIDLCHEHDVPVKVIFETDALTRAEIAAAAEASVAAGADFIKTSTGFYTGSPQHPETGASDDIVAFMLKCADGRCKVKASGAIRDVNHFFRLIDAGIDRMGIGYRTTPVVLGRQPTATGAANTA
jgi:deoxyribose-phosphate aldolase